MPLTPRARAVAALLLLLSTLPAGPARAQQTRDPGAKPALEAPALRATLATPLQWRDLLANGARKLHTDVYPSIDLALSGNRNLVSLHFVARPGSDFGAIAFDLAGTEQLTLDRAVTAFDPARHERIRLAPPEAFQMAAGAKDTIEARYVRRADGRFGIELGAHAPALPVVVTVSAGYVAAPDARAAAPASPEVVGPDVSATMTDQVIPDADNDGKANPGETIRYTTEIKNNGPVVDAEGVQLDDTIDPNTTLTAGTVKTTPLAYAQTVPTLEDNAVTVHLTGNDPDGGSLTFSIDTGPTIGGLGAITPTGATTADVTYTPNANANGSDSFVFKVTDTDANTDVATVSITITPVNDAPTFACGADQTHTVGDGPAISVAGWATGISAGPANESGQTLAFHVTGNTDPGLFSVAPTVDPATGDLTYTLAGTTGSSEITLTLQDAGGTASGGVDTSTPCTFKVTVNGPPTAVNDAPAAASAPGDAFHTALNTILNSATDAATPSLLANDDLGFPAGTLVSFGGGGLGGAVTDHAAGATVAVGSGSLTVNADGEFVFTPDTGFNGLFTFQYRLENSAGHSDATVTIGVGVRPNAVADGLNATGNVRVDAGVIPFSVLTNDAGDGISVTGMDATSANGGTVVNSGAGAFTYNPPPGYEGSDTFGYTITNGFGNATGTVTMTVSGMIWFIDNAAASAGDGRLGSPFQTLAAFNAVNGNGGASDPEAGDNIFIAQGSGSYTGGIHLVYNQKLIGDGSSSNLAAITGITPAPGSDPLPVFTGTDPVIENASGNAITLALTNTVRGLTAGNAPSGFSIGGGIVGALTIQEVSVIGTGGALGIGTSGTASTVQFDQLSSTAAPAQAILLTGFSGTISVTAGSITDPVGTAVAVSGGSPTLSYPGAITKNNAGRVVDVDGTSDGALTFNGAITQNNAAGTGIRVANTSGPAAVTFTGLSVANSGGGIGFQNNTGSVSVTGSANTISTTGAVAVDIVSSNIGSSGITLQSVSATNATRGIRLDNTGSVGGSFFTVTGTGTTDGSGGTIAGSTTEGITLNNCRAVTIKNLNVTGTASGTNAVGATTVNGLTFDNCELNAAAGGTSHALLGSAITALTATGSIFDGGGGSVPTVNAVDITGLFGNSSFNGTTFRNGKDNNVAIHNSTAVGAPDLLTIVNGTTFSNSAIGDHLNVLADGTANLKVDVKNGGGSNVTLNGTSQDGMQFLAQGTGHLEADVTQAAFSGNAGSALNLSAGNTAALTATVQNLTGLTSGATNVINMIGFDNSTITASVLNNTINLGAGSYTGIRAIQEGNGTVTASISGNTISGPGNEWGIRGQARAGTGHLNLNVNNNNVTLSNSIALEGIAIESGSSAGTDQNSICLNMAGNSSSTAGIGLTAYRLRVRSATTAFDLQNFAGSGTSTTDVANWVNATKGNTGSTLVTIGAGASFAASAGNCATP